MPLIFNIPQNNFNSLTAPTVNSDESVGYSAGSQWLDKFSTLNYICVDASVGAAVWDLVI